MELIESPARRFDLDQAVDGSEATDEFHVGRLRVPVSALAMTLRRCRLMQINHRPLLRRNVQRCMVWLCEEMGDGQRLSGLVSR